MLTPVVLLSAAASAISLLVSLAVFAYNIYYYRIDKTDMFAAIQIIDPATDRSAVIIDKNLAQGRVKVWSADGNAMQYQCLCHLCPTHQAPPAGGEPVTPGTTP